MVQVSPAPGGLRITGADGQAIFVPLHEVHGTTQAMKDVVYRGAAEEALSIHQTLSASYLHTEEEGA